MKNRVRKYRKDGELDLTGLVSEWAFKHNKLYAITDLEHPVWDAAMYYVKDYRDFLKSSERSTAKIMKEAEKAKIERTSKKKKRKKAAGKAA